ncbi:WbqC family protein [Bdellovibrio bacteriovorus]|uniref:WbqC family protein n=1 Tax=Bdellovibrio bacteriovorus TaxID=959 RepID=UPI0035A5D7BC
MKKVVILQSNYIPWKGYFDLIWIADEFIILDDVQYTKNDWRNRNQIKTVQGKKWLTIPVTYKFSERPLISSITVCSPNWVEEHLAQLKLAYQGAPYYSEFLPHLESWYGKIKTFDKLSEINLYLLQAIADYLEIGAKLTKSSLYITTQELQSLDKNHRLAEICARAKATDYITGPSALSYLDESVFKSQGINVHVADYGSYGPYPQQHGEFDHYVTILDLIFNLGKNAQTHLRKIKLVSPVTAEPSKELT